jgi:UDP-3-O-[3-hydroxymyristoyl] N-acetylglucosamine deacetylase
MADIDLDPETFEREICRARTFGFLHEVEALWRAGLARGGSFANTIVLDGERILNTGGTRWRDEFVRHKVLDLLGDLALLGARIQGHVRVSRGGHRLHQELVAQILRSPEVVALREPVPAFSLADRLRRLVPSFDAPL